MDRVRTLMTDAEIATLDALNAVVAAATDVKTEADRVVSTATETMGTLIRAVYARQPQA